MDPVDGNAIAGALFEHFGHEMTMAEVRCLHCRTTTLMAQLRVYMNAPGAVARCPTCNGVVMVIVSVRETERFDMSNVEMVSPA
jgi:Zn finger protein HypA/HybF involved in hydrogenase expression